MNTIRSHTYYVEPVNASCHEVCESDLQQDLLLPLQRCFRIGRWRILLVGISYDEASVLELLDHLQWEFRLIRVTEDELVISFALVSHGELLQN